MNNLMFCLNATMPIFLSMLLGFEVALPVLVFQDLATVYFFEAWDGKFVLFCFLATLISIAAVTLLSFLLKDKIQALSCLRRCLALSH